MPGAPAAGEESERARELAELFGRAAEQETERADEQSDDAGERLAALFAEPAREEAFSTAPVAAAAKDRLPATPPAAVEPSAYQDDLPDDEPIVMAGAGAVASAAVVEPVRQDDAPAEAVEDDPLAWLGLVEEPAVEPTEKKSAAATAGWAGIVGGAAVAGSASAAAPEPPAAEKTAVLPAATEVGTSAGAFFPAERRRGIRGWSTRVRWSVAVSIVLLIGVIAGSVVIAQMLAANNLAAQELAAAVAELEAAETAATEPESVLKDSVAAYDESVLLARGTADSAGPALAAVVGVTEQAPLDAANAALAALTAQLDADSLADPPAPYERGDVDLTDIDAVRAATATAEDHGESITAATRAVGAAQTSLQEKLVALRNAQVALGVTIPETAVRIVGENEEAEQSLRDAVIAASLAVGAAQNAGASGDPELIAYAAAVAAMRADQERVINGDTQESETPTTETNPEPAPAPAPTQEPVPEPVPPPTEPSTPPGPTPPTLP
ncbi:hypothetical protein [Microbacterium sp. cf046]|uniref:hypothetical protein n=1 Tax=Microbacterium sp. cf046 TaxID=1761803 RepID=UPI00111468B6|nr:hypothetical protein [Microbacterium sp. cf046]